MKGIGAIVQIVGGAAPHDHAVAFARGFSNDLLGHFADAIGVRHFHVRGVQASFKTASQKGFEQPVVQRIAALLALLDVTRSHSRWRAISSVSSWSHSFQPRRSATLLRDVGRAAPVFALHRQHFDHGLSLYSITRRLRPPPGSFLRTMNASTNMMLAAIASTMNVSI